MEILCFPFNWHRTYRNLTSMYGVGTYRTTYKNAFEESCLVPDERSYRFANEAPLEGFTGFVFNLFVTTMEPHLSSPEPQANLVRKYFVPEMTYNLCPTGLPLNSLNLKGGAPAMVIHNVLHPNNIEWKILCSQIT